MSAALLTRKQAAARMGVSIRTIERMDRVGNGPGFVRISERAVRYDPAAVDRFIADRHHPHRAAELARGAPQNGHGRGSP